ncbi:unnamed protein product, partial [Schistosoma turkestanicum]
GNYPSGNSVASNINHGISDIVNEFNNALFKVETNQRNLEIQRIKYTKLLSKQDWLDKIDEAMNNDVNSA